MYKITELSTYSLQVDLNLIIGLSSLTTSISALSMDEKLILTVCLQNSICSFHVLAVNRYQLIVHVRGALNFQTRELGAISKIQNGNLVHVYVFNIWEEIGCR